MALPIACRSGTLHLSKCFRPSAFNLSLVGLQQMRCVSSNKHKDPKWKNLRRLKVWTSVPIPTYRGGEHVDPEHYQVSYGRYRYWQDREFYVSTTGVVMDEFVPPENESTSSSFLENRKEQWKSLTKTGRDKLALRKIRQFEKDFNLNIFVDEAKDVYIKAHECLVEHDFEKLTNYVTEMARGSMLGNTKNRTIRWKYLESLEEPQVVRIISQKMDEQDDFFSQITVRMHSKQILAVYDRFGRLTYGSEILAKDVLEYVVFEKHLSNEYGVWRLHHKIIPDCFIRPAEHTFVKPQDPEEVEEESVDAVEPVKAEQTESGPQPAVV